MGIMSAWGAFIGLLVSIFLIIRKVSPVYSLILGALVGGLLGGVSLPETVSLMISGVNSGRHSDLDGGGIVGDIGENRCGGFYLQYDHL